MISSILSLLSAAVSIYTILCLIDIFMSWLPGIKFTSFGRFISAITEPYMGFFSRLRFLRFGHVDFSPILSIGILSLVSSILSSITATGRIWFGGILASVVSMLWSVVSSVLSIFCIVILIRCLAKIIRIIQCGAILMECLENLHTKFHVLLQKDKSHTKHHY